MERFLRFKAGAGASPPMGRFLFDVPPLTVLMLGSWLCDGYGGEWAGGDV